LLPVPSDIALNLDGAKKADVVKKLHERISQAITKRNEQIAARVNKSRKKMVFQPGDWVWVHMSKERFPTQRKSKLMPRGEGPFQVLSKITDNAYKIDLPSEYGNVSATFNVAHLSPFDADEHSDSWTNPSKGEGVDEDMDGLNTSNTTYPQVQDPLQVLEGPQVLEDPITRARVPRFREAMCTWIEKMDWAAIYSTQGGTVQGLGEAHKYNFLITIHKEDST